MAVDYTIHPDLRIVVTRFVDVVTDDEFVGLYRDVFADSDYALGTNELADLREVTSLDVSARALRRVESITRERYGQSSEKFRSAVLAPRDHAYGIGRMYEVFAEEGPENVRVCREVEEALEWLGLPGDAIDL